jgi:hypothetical protein
MDILRSVLAASLLVIAACPRADEGEGPFCEDTATVVALDEDTALGLPARVLTDLAVTPSPFAATLTLARGGTTPLTLLVDEVGEARFVDSEAVYPDDGVFPAIAIECPDRVELDVTGHFTSDDGAFAEVFPTTLRATAADTATFSAVLDATTLQGSHDATLDVDEPDIATLDVVIDATFDAAGSHGLVHTVATGEEQCVGNECTAWAADIEVGTW